jgi:hypothetical protein
MAEADRARSITSLYRRDSAAGVGAGRGIMMACRTRDASLVLRYIGSIPTPAVEGGFCKAVLSDLGKLMLPRAFPKQFRDRALSGIDLVLPAPFLA